MRAQLVSTSEHKLRELAAALPGWQLELLDVGGRPPEDAPTYYENARAKAEFGRLAGAAGAWVLADDSGIEVEALGGRPGVHSNRWARPGEDHVQKLLAELAAAGGASRGARYVCELVALSPADEEFRGTGVLNGRVAESPRGSEGFGYDPIFVPTGETHTVAELGDAWKAEHSHRARAAKALLEAVRAAHA